MLGRRHWNADETFTSDQLETSGVSGVSSGGDGTSVIFVAVPIPAISHVCAYPSTPIIVVSCLYTPLPAVSLGDSIGAFEGQALEMRWSSEKIARLIVGLASVPPPLPQFVQTWTALCTQLRWGT